jgi:type I restriction enzyme, S subunit
LRQCRFAAGCGLGGVAGHLTPLGGWYASHTKFLTGSPFGSQLHSYDYVPSGVPVVPTEGIGRRRLVTEGIPEVAEETAARLSRHRLKSGDILFARRGVQATGLSAIVTPRQEGWLCGTGAILLRVKGQAVDPEFLSFFLSAEESVLWLKQHAVGAVMPNLNEGVIRQIPLMLPPLTDQKAIASVLSALDDKIEVNRRMNSTLEAMARALFQSWFVDFDPVRAKIDGRQPVGIDPVTAALFPTTFQDSEAGHIPNGWRVCNLGSLTDYLSRGIGPSYLERGGVCVLNQKCIRDHRVDFSKSRRHDSTKKPVNGRALQLYDVLVNSTGMGTLGRVAQLFQLPETTIVDSHVTIVRASSKTDPFFLGMSLTGREDEIEELGEGSTGQTELSRTRLGALKVITPPFELQVAFGVAVRPLLLRIAENEAQSLTLATLRDTLLPKLLSGELSVAH